MGMNGETERSMLDRLRKRYGQTYANGSYVGRQYVVAEKVPTSPGSYFGDRIADAIVLDTRLTAHAALTDEERESRQWGERQSIHGFEVKVSRADWLTELSDPEKALAWSRYCHYFWLVAADKTIVRDDLPPGWGLLVPHGTGLRAVRKPTRQLPDPMPLPRLVSLARAVQRTEVAMAHPSTDPYADCVCGHGRHTHVRYYGACGLCGCIAVREPNERGSGDGR